MNIHDKFGDIQEIAEKEDWETEINIIKNSKSDINKTELVICPYCRKTLLGGRWVYYFSRRLFSKYIRNDQICPECLQKQLLKLQ